MTKKETMGPKTPFSLKHNTTPFQPESTTVTETFPSHPIEGGDQWKRFIEAAEELKKKASVQDRGAQVWVDSDIKHKLELLHSSLAKDGMNFPVRHLVNAALSVFLETNEEDIKKQLKNNTY